MATFLETLFGQKPDDTFILIWTLKGKRSDWCRTVEEAERLVENRAHVDCYVGVGLSPRDYGPDHRCPANEVAGIVGLWVDLDYLHPCHKKTALPPDEAAALEFLHGLPLAPSVIVHSGHGLQAWWLFKEPWVFESDAERGAAASLAEAWQRTIRSHAHRKGWDVDSTADLARIMRVPGTRNCKAEPVDVRWLR